MSFVKSRSARKLGWWAATIILVLVSVHVESGPSALNGLKGLQGLRGLNARLLGSNTPGSASWRANVPPRARLAQNYARLPLSFEANLGQTDSRVKFLARGRGYGLFLAEDEAVLALQPRGAAALSLKLVGANPQTRVQGVDELPGKANYFIGNRPSEWRTNVPTYARVVYQGVYPGVNLAYYGSLGRLEYDFVVSPGADPRVIRLALDGSTRVGRSQSPVGSPLRNSAHADSRLPTPYSLRVAPNGDLVMKIHGGELHFLKPVVYQTARTPSPLGASLQGGPESRTPVAGRYKVTGHNQVSFELGAYDRSRTLVIDPVLAFSSFIGGSATASANSIAVDAAGNAYLTGSTTSANFPVTPGVTQRALAGLQNVFVSEVNASGTALVYSTYLGGNNTDNGFGIAVDSAGNAYVTGATNSMNFPTTAGVKQTALMGGVDAFVSKLAPGGASLVYSTYLGGTLDDQANAIAVDSSGNAYITGVTDSMNFPTTKSPFQSALGGGLDAFFVKLNSTGGAPLLYGTYLGGSGNDIGHDIAIDSSGNAYIAGETNSTNFPVTAGAAQAANGGGSDAFVAKINPATQSTPSLVYSTYLGGAGNDFGFGIALDSATNAYVTGSTTSTNFPVTTGVVQSAFGGGTDDAFVAKLNSTGSTFVYSTYLGGNGFDRGNSIAVDSSGNTYVTGSTQSTNFTGLPGAASTLNPVQASCSGNPCDDAFVTSLNAGATAFVYSTYLGGSAHAEGDKIVLDSSANAYVAGFTLAADFPTTAGVFQAACDLSTSGACNSGLVFKLTAPAPVEAVPSVLSFGEQLLKTTSPSQITTISNHGATSLTITNFSASGDFAVAAAGTTCSTSTAVAAGASCNIAVTFTPTATGPRTGTLTVTDSAGSQEAVLTGTGTSPSVSVTPTSLTFSQSVGATSEPMTVTLTNTGQATLSISSIAVMTSPPYAQTNTCGASLAAGAICTIGVTFAPTKSGSANGTLTITDNAASSPQTVTLTGTGVAPAVTLTPASLNFNSVNVGVTSAAQSVMLANTGNATLSSINFSLSGTNAGDFKISTNNCGSTLPQGQSCTFSVTFTPAPGASASRSAMVVIADNAPGGSESVALAGMGADFSTAATPSSATVSAGQSATFTLTETSIGGFNSPVALTCTAPTGFLGSCTISLPSVTPSPSTAGTATVTVSTLAPAGLVPGPGLPPGPRILPWLGALLGLAALALATAERRRRVWLALTGALLAAMLGVACGSASNSVTGPGTTPGTYTFTLTGTANSLAHTTTVTVTVTGG